GDVGWRHRAEEDAVRAGLDLEAEHRLPERLGDLLTLLEARGLVPRADGVALLEFGDARRRRLLRELPRQQVVPGEPPRDRDDLAAKPDLLDVLQQDDVH